MSTQQPVITIAYDAKRAVANATGLGSYSRRVIDAISSRFPGRYILYTPKPDTDGRLDAVARRDGVELVSSERTGGMSRAMWRTFGLTGRLRADGVTLYHGLSNELPLNIARAGIPTVVTIHDLIFRRSRADYSAIDRLIYDFKYRRSARAATRVIAISECTRRDIISDWHIDPDRIDVVYQSVDPIYSAPVDPDMADTLTGRLGLVNGRYIMAVGTVQPRKNVLQAVRGLDLLPRDVVLVIVGRFVGEYGRTVLAEIKRRGLQDRVIMPGYLTTAELAALYSRAAFSTYTSRYEGFGLPIVESIMAGTPVIAATGSCLEEAGGPGAFYVDPDDDNAWTDAAITLLDDASTRRRMVQDGHRYALERFTDDAFARATMAVYRRALQQSNQSTK